MLTVPLLESLRVGARQEVRSPATVLFAAAIVTCAGFLLALPFSRTIQGVIVRKYCLAYDSFVPWAGLQLVPSMYNFGNRLWVSTREIPISSLEWEVRKTDPLLIQDRWINHYPLVLRRLDLVREHPGQPMYVYCGSRYRGHEWITEIVVSEDSHSGIRYRYVRTVERAQH